MSNPQTSIPSIVVSPINPPPPVILPVPQPDLTRFNQLVKKNEFTPLVAKQLYEVLSTCDIVLLCDDSDSMSKEISEEGTDPFGPKRSTRWLELKKLVASITDIVTSINPNGFDCYFLNRPKICNVTSSAGLQSVFSVPPDGPTPLIGMINRIYEDKKHIPLSRNLLLIVIFDGEATDGSRDDLYWTLVNKRQNVHISFAECTDNAEDMEFLDAWDGRIQNFDNNEDYREQLNRVKMIQGPQFKFDYNDYVTKILLATFVRWYFNLDQVKVSPTTSLPGTTQQYRPPQPTYQNYQTSPSLSTSLTQSYQASTQPLSTQSISSNYQSTCGSGSCQPTYTVPIYPSGYNQERCCCTIL